MMTEKKVKVAPSILSADFSDMGSEGFFEQVAVCEEALLEKYIENGTLDRERDLVPAVAGRSVFPCFFGSALRLDGVEAFLDGFSDLTTDVERGSEFGGTGWFHDISL